MSDARVWRLWIVAALAGVYVLVWSRIAPSHPAPAAHAAAVAPAAQPLRIRTRSS